ncbi:MAG: carboxypeptidase regulatory-like domain-containing protein [Gemmatimonadetes bacterium]|nr:carboxypeptidase regulatory-like domain-containing protein [Gemmatimonadota bacterium]
MSGWRRASAKIAFGAWVVAAGCGKGGESGGAEGGAAAAATAFPVDTTTAATITGRIAFTGTKPAMQRIDMSEEATCAQKHPDGAFTESVVVNDDGTLRNVFIYVKSGLPANLTFPVPSAPVEIDQDGCVYLPHVFGIQVGQTLSIRNSDGLLHNIKAVPTTNRPFNISQPMNMTTARTFASSEIMVPLQCNVHSWMSAFVGVLPHPYFSVSGADGAFRIGRLPPGTYEIEAWHERLGPQTQTVTVGASETKDVAFTFRGS